METKDIMIGDWVQLLDDETGKAYKKAKVDGIRKDGRTASITETGSFAAWNLVHIAPIPLTPEILEKNGFKKTQNGYEWKERLCGYMGQSCSSTTPIEIICTPEGHYYVSNPHKGCVWQGGLSYVHQLQHALCLCGIEKEIEL